MRGSYYSSNGHVLPRIYGKRGYYLSGRNRTVIDDEPEPEPTPLDMDRSDIDMNRSDIDMDTTETI